MSVLALVGPTASGKSAVALALAERRGDVEVVATDAFTLYRGMDVGTAKPDPDVRRRVAHHLVDVLDPWEPASVAWFQERARAAIADVRARGRVPLLVGGSGLYFRAVVDDLRFPPTDPAVRGTLEDRYRDAPEEAHRDLAVRDPDAAARIEPGNLRRSVRALEVIELTGRPFSSFAADWERYRPVYDDLVVRGTDTDDLRARIEGRARAMVGGGLLEEARRLRSSPRPLSRTAEQAIGYAEAFAVLDGELAEDDLAEAVARRTWRYARRQRSWFRADPRVVWSSPADVLDAWS